MTTDPSIIGSVLAFLVAIGILIAVHEYGHYIVGRCCNMKVLRFSIGFGKPLLRRVAGADRTEYVVAAVPLGGYVRFLDSREGSILPEDQGRAFDQRPVWQRIAVLSAGPLFNFLFAVVAYWALFVYGVPTAVPAIGDVAPDSYAQRAGLEVGDRILAVHGRPSPDWEATLLAMLDQLVAEGRIDLSLEGTDGRRRTASLIVDSGRTRLTEPGMLFAGLGFQPWRLPALIGDVRPGGAAAVAGLRAGDRIIAVDGERVGSFNELTALVAPRPDAAVDIRYRRASGGAIAEDTVRAVLGSAEQDGQTVGRLGITSANVSDYRYLRQYGLGESLGKALVKTWDMSVFTLKMLGRMLTGDVSIKNISGPINIAQFAGQSAERGPDYFLSFLAIVSISLGILNLLPIPVLDGGQIVYQSIEFARGSPLSERAHVIGQQAGIVALLLLMSFAFYNDIARILG